MKINFLIKSFENMSASSIFVTNELLPAFPANYIISYAEHVFF